MEGEHSSSIRARAREDGELVGGSIPPCSAARSGDSILRLQLLSIAPVHQLERGHILQPHVSCQLSFQQEVGGLQAAWAQAMSGVRQAPAAEWP